MSRRKLLLYAPNLSARLGFDTQPFFLGSDPKQRSEAKVRANNAIRAGSESILHRKAACIPEAG
jgi:hypothetical protein